MSGFGEAPPADHTGGVHSGSPGGEAAGDLRDLQDSPECPVSPPLWLSEEEEVAACGQYVCSFTLHGSRRRNSLICLTVQAGEEVAPVARVHEGTGPPGGLAADCGAGRQSVASLQRPVRHGQGGSGKV